MPFYLKQNRFIKQTWFCHMYHDFFKSIYFHVLFFITHKHTHTANLFPDSRTSCFFIKWAENLALQSTWGSLFPLSREQTWDVSVYWAAYFPCTAPFPKTRAHLETDTTPKGEQVKVWLSVNSFIIELFQTKSLSQVFLSVTHLCYEK